MIQIEVSLRGSPTINVTLVAGMSNLGCTSILANWSMMLILVTYQGSTLISTVTWVAKN